MRLTICLFLLAATVVQAQSLGRLPGTVYPSDRGVRTLATLQSIDTVGRPAYEWRFDGAWPITDDFSFKAGDVVTMLPGSYFTISSNTTLTFAGAEFNAPAQACFYGYGTTAGAVYPHLKPEWAASGVTNYALPLGYLDPPYAFSNVYQVTTGLTNLAGNVNLAAQLQYIADNWHTLQGYASSNQVNTLSNTTVQISSNVAALSSNIFATATNLHRKTLLLDLVAKNTFTQVFTAASMQGLTNWTSEWDFQGLFDTNSGVFTVPTNGYYSVNVTTRGTGPAAQTRDLLVFEDGTNNIVARNTFYCPTNNSGSSAFYANFLTNGQSLAVGVMLYQSGWTNTATTLQITHSDGGNTP